MKFRIHRGAKQIGGNCVEIEEAGKRLVLDLGMPLDADDPETVLMPDVPGINRNNDGSLLALVISHPHGDHYGLAPRVSPDLPLAMGAAAHRIVRASAPFLKNSGAPPDLTHALSDGKVLNLGPFAITPFLMDHSAYDSYALHIEAGGRSLFYSGDFRAHGRKSGLFERMMRRPPASVHALLLEGTTLGRDHGPPVTEEELTAVAADVMRRTSGLVLAAFSPQNIDRYVTFFRAAIQTGRSFVIDPYLAEVIEATGNPKIPGSGGAGILIHTPRSMAASLHRKGRSDLVEAFRPLSVPLEKIAEAPGRYVMIFRKSMDKELLACPGLLNGACVAYSMWSGYLKRGKPPLNEWCKEQGIGFETVHTSGHADPDTLQRLIGALKPSCVVPIHTEHPESYPKAGAPIVHANDGDWVEV